MRILFVSDRRHPPQGLGGARVSTEQLAERLVDRGHEVGVLAQLRAGDRIWLWNRFRAKFSGHPCPPDRWGRTQIFRCWRPEGYVGAAVRTFRPDVGVAGTSATWTLAGKLMENEVPAVAYFRALELESVGAVPTVTGPLKAVAVSSYVARRVEELYGHPCEVVPSVVEPSAYVVPTRGDRVLHVNPDPCKGIETTLDLARARPDLQFDVVRCWPLTEEVRAIRERVRKLANVHWHEPVGDMRTLYAQARVLVVPSVCEEASARVVREAQFSGIPVLASHRGGLPEAVGAGGITLSIEDSIETWAEALDAVYAEGAPGSRMSEAARAHARRPEVDPDTVVSRFEDLLDRCIRSAPESVSDWADRSNT